MADRIRLEIVTPEKEVFHAMVESFIVPSLLGSAGILYNHAPMLAVLEPGVIKYCKDNQEHYIAVGTGFMELRNNEAEILVNTAELSRDIDIARAQAAAERAHRRLADKSANIDRARAEAALKRALARIKATSAK
ncbi:MAG: F0F1 ATP synthase subunit epsilon [Clostridia bacterium]|nr:F0F1 ATP synthase subunit epsilon [Clostridia bacterium]